MGALETMTEEGLAKFIAGIVLEAMTQKEKAATAGTSDKEMAGALLALKLMPHPELSRHVKMVEIGRNGPKEKAEAEMVMEQWIRHKLFPGWFEDKCVIDRQTCKRILADSAHLLLTKATLTTVDAGSGGDLVATQYLMEAIIALQNIAEFRNYVEIINMTQDMVNWPVITNSYSALYRGEDAGEGGAITESGSTTAYAQLTAKTCATLTEKITRELVADSRVAMVPIVSRMLSDKIRVKEQAVFATGNGTTQPKGLSNMGFTAIGQIAAAFQYKDINKLFYRLPQQYRKDPRCCWMMNNDTKNMLADLQDDFGRPILQDPKEGALETIKGRPVVELPDIAGTASTGSTSTIYFGNFYLGCKWGDRAGLEIEATDVAGDNFGNHTVQVKGTTRNDCNVGDVSAVIRMTGVSDNAAAGS